MGGANRPAATEQRKCAEVPGLSKTKGEGLDQWRCTGRGHHWWCLTEGPGNGADLIQYTCSDAADNRFWAID
ncbi:hypothetical protein ABZ953_10445 [Streptomyces sp. NPDC046465]|uniref:RICIN domain-containing protein n=1 Tax=Streptomyces sp. NPDC046465 TaxID=3155810 RepID=UPI00340FC192